ncbi:hypothetical protein BDW62DRAFT_66179 [Aspergillus aurantiobrunneus]
MKVQAAAVFLVGTVSALPASSSSTAVPSSTSTPSSTPNPASEKCANNDDSIWTQDNWDADGRDMTQWYNDWYQENIKGDDKIDQTFGLYWGLGPSFSCDIDNECAAPQCSALKRPSQSQDYEAATMFLASMSNFNRQYSRIYQALDGAKIDFGAFQTKLQQTFFPGIQAADMKKIQGMNGGLTTVGYISAWSGPFAPLVNTAKETLGGISRGLNVLLTASDKSVKNTAELATVFTEKIDEVRKEFAKVHDDVLKWGVTEFTAIDQIFEGGAYVDDRKIPVLNDISVEDMRDYARKMFYAMAINNAWVKQGAYIYSREMAEDDCNEYSINRGDNMPPGICYQDRIYYLNVFQGQTGEVKPLLKAIPGWEELENEIGTSYKDAMLSSIDAFNKGGYKYNATDYLDEIFDGDIQEKVDMGSRVAGIWNIPVCEVESSAEFADTGLDGKKSDASGWSKVDKNTLVNTKMPGGGGGVQVCLCSTAKDRNGVEITEIEDLGSGSFKSVVDSKANNRCYLHKEL